MSRRAPSRASTSRVVPPRPLLALALTTAAVAAATRPVGAQPPAPAGVPAVDTARTTPALPAASTTAPTAAAERPRPSADDATARVDATAESLLAAARRARVAQDSALVAYDALSRERVTTAIGLRDVAPSATVFRQETAARVRWSRGGGVALDLLGRRRYAFGTGAKLRNVMGDDLAPVPYYPGRDALWVGGGRLVRPDVDTTQLVHPLARGAERFYRYALGDAQTIRLPDGTRIPLRELRITPLRPSWQLSVGSFWFDARTGQLVRAAYRVAAPMDFYAEAKRSGGGPPAWVKLFASPMTGQIDAVTIEHALHENRFWLPRAQYAEGTIRAGTARVGIRLEQSFRYDAVYGAVNGAVYGAPPAGPAPTTVAASDSAAERATMGAVTLRDSVWAVALARRDSLFRGARTAADSARADSAYDAWWRREALPRYTKARTARQVEACRAAGRYATRATRYGDALGRGTVVRIPCDTAALAAAPIFEGRPVLDPAEATWGSAARAELLGQLGLARQAAWGPQPVRVAYGPEFLRANRVEGVSYGAALRRELGAGWRWEANARVGVHDVEPNGEAFVERTDGRTTLRAGAYRRLAISDDWGTGFTIGATVQNLLEGLDEQFYYRAGGVEVAGSRSGDALAGGGLSWRLFGEHQWRARGDATLALPALFGTDSAYLRNVLDTVPARPGTVGGAAVRWRANLVGDATAPWRLATDVRTEAAGGSFAWARAAVDATVERALPGRLRAVVTGAAGSSAGQLPPQRWWNLGGWQTVRGMLAGSQRGPAFWSTRSELRWQRVGLLQPAAFFDAGWAGERARLFDGGRPLRGAGGGVAILNGLARFDVARGLDRGARWRADFYAVARF